MQIEPGQALPLAGGAAPDADAVLRQRATAAAEKFEAFFIKQMLGQMRAATRQLADEDSPLKNRINQDMLDMADGVVADSMAGQRAFGIADMLLQQLLPPADLSVGAGASPSSGEASLRPDAASP